MAEFTDQAKQHFPLQDIKSVVALFRSELTGDAEPNLAMLSVVTGMIESSLTSNRAAAATQQNAKELETNRAGIEPIFPVIELPNVEALYCKFETQMKGSVDLSKFKSDYATRDLVKLVSDIIWGSLTRYHYKERAHLQSLFSYLTASRLDCFGVAFAVVAACQRLGYADVHLALSEDHAWVMYGESGDDTAEVTWHGKGNEDKRGQPISLGIEERSWLYLNGHPVICTRQIEVASMVSAINPSVTGTVDSVELASLQQELLWLLYDLGHLKKYPTALGNLGDLESINPTPDRPSTYDLFQEAIQAGQEFYEDHHVYPYTYLGGHSYRQRQYKAALENWALAANVVSRYNYSREDEEVYKEFLEIANDLIPYIVKTGSTGESRVAASVLRDPECYSYVLRFYDGICKWEEGSATPIFHITWAKHFMATVTKFSVEARHRVDVGTKEDNEDEEEDDDDKEETEDGEGNGEVKQNGKKEEEEENKEDGDEVKCEMSDGDGEVEDINKNIVKDTKSVLMKRKKSGRRSRQKNPDRRAFEQVQGLNIEVLEATCAEESDSMIAASEPISTSSVTTSTSTGSTSHLLSSSWDAKTDFNDFLSTRSNGSAFPGMTMESVMKAESPAEMAFQRRLKAIMSSEDEEDEEEELDDEDEEKDSDSDSDSSSESTACATFHIPPPKVSFHSHKMWGLKEILTTSGKLNTAAIQLQLTAQSQTTVSKRPRAHNDYEDFGTLRRRPRRF